jgi:hypothetical protein
MKKYIALFFLSVFAISCSKDEANNNTFQNATVNTKNSFVSSSGVEIITGGTLSVSITDQSYQVGVCYNLTGTPTVNDNLAQNGSSNDVSFDAVIPITNFGSTYYLRAYVMSFNTGEVKYGNQVVVTTQQSVVTDIVKNITATGFKVDVTVAGALGNNTERGICYSTSSNPTVSNSTIPSPTFGAGAFTITVENFPISSSYYVTAGTTYYLRSYVRVNGNYYYGNQVQFKTCGYTGGSGGVVFYDKGETTNGWRYLESAPYYFIYNNDVNWLFMWNNCGATTFINGLSNEIGTGLENSNIIKPLCNFTSNAAAMARSNSLNGLNDWFLPSLEELKLLYKAKYAGVISYNGFYTLISSSQQTNSVNYGVDFSNGATVGMNKNSAGRIWQVRRF